MPQSQALLPAYSDGLEALVLICALHALAAVDNLHSEGSFIEEHR